MIETVCTVLGTSVVVGGVIVGIMNGFYKTNKQAQEDYSKIQEDYEKKMYNLETRLEKEFKDDSVNLKTELEKIGDKIDEMKTRYVTNENFKTYAESMSQLLKMTSDRMSRIESTLDDIREDMINLFHKKTDL